MISLQDVEYTDFIYWQETENFINGVASATGNIELFFDEKVDRDSSLVLYDGKEIDLNNEHTFIDIQKEGITQLVFILKDIDGYALQEGEKTILLDTTRPDIVFNTNNQKILDVLPLEDKETIHVKIFEENVESIQVYLDDEQIDCEGLEFDVDVTSKNQSLRIVCTDIAQNKVEREIKILPIEYPECLLNSAVYIKENHSNLQFESICKQAFNLHVYCDGIYYYSLDLEDKDQVVIDHSKNGKYTFELEHKVYPQFKKRIEGSIEYSNILPVVTLTPSSKLSNEDVIVNAIRNVSKLERGYIDVDLNGIKTRYALNETIRLPAIHNQDVIYCVSAYAKDIYGHEVSDQIYVQIDKKAPASQLFMNNEVVVDRMKLKKLPSLEYKFDDSNAYMRVEYYLNDTFMDMDFEKVFNRMVKDDVLKIVTYTSDALMNLEKKEYEFVFSPDKEIEMVSKSEQVLEKDEVVEFERVWVVNEDNEVVLKKNTKRIQKASKPEIHYTRKKNKVQIWSEDKIEYVLVNGKRILIEKDVVGHDYVEISLKKKKTSIEVKTKHREVLKKEEIKRSAVRITFMQKIRMWFKQIFKL